MIDNSKTIELLQGYYHFLYVGKFLETIIQQKDIAQYAKDIPLKTGENSSFTIKGETIKTLLKQIHQSPNKKNLFGYMVETNAWKGIFSIMRELLQDKESFQRFIQQTLSDQYFAFEQIIIFSRNILTHTIDSKITLEKESILGQKNYLADRKIHHIHFDFLYAEYIGSRAGSKTYGVSITLDFKKLKEGKSLFDFISIHQLYMMVELCHNLCTLYKQSKISNKTPTYNKHETKTYHRRVGEKNKGNK